MLDKNVQKRQKNKKQTNKYYNYDQISKLCLYTSNINKDQTKFSLSPHTHTQPQSLFTFSPEGLRQTA